MIDEREEAAYKELLIHDLIKLIGEDVSRDGLKDTPHRVIKSWDKIFSGYKWTNESIKKMMTEFENDEEYDEFILLKNIEFYSTCEHHMLPFFGVAHVAYIPRIEEDPPNGKSRIVGISKLARLVDIYSRRLQTQERICKQVTEVLMKYLNPIGAACILQGRHLCMMSRGIKQTNVIMETISLTGVFKENISTRNELISRIDRK